VKSKTPQPKVFVSSVYQLLGPFQFYPFIPKQGAEKKHLKRHPANHPEGATRTLYLTRFYPGKRPLLPTYGWYMEWHWSSCPFQDSVNKADKEYGNGSIRDYNTKHRILAKCLYSYEGKQYKY